jgi:hypothetical protein
MRSQELFAQAGLEPMILHISAFQVARITGVSHCCPVVLYFLFIYFLPIHPLTLNSSWTRNSSTHEFEAGGWGVLGQPGLRSKILSQNKLKA